MAEGPSHQQQQQQQHHHHHHLLLQHHHPPPPPPPSPPPPPQRSRFGGGGLRSIPGEIVEVQGGHIVRSTGRKDRHSKVCTAKGPRDRRVRLSAHTAIQFYDVQDRLGYDRPSKAVDWLIKAAKSAIDELAELPAWHPTATVNPPAPPSNQDASHGGEATDDQMHVAGQGRGSSSHYEFGGGSGGGGGGGGGGGSSFLPPSLHSDAIADTIKSFFPMAAAAASNSSISAAAPSSSSPIGFQNYPPDLLSPNTQNQDLRLSLQSFQDPIFHHPSAQHHHHQQQHQTTNAAGHHGIFSSFDASAMVPWNVQESSGGGGGGDGGSGNVVGGGYVFNVPLQPQHHQAVAMHPGLGHGHSQSQFFTQRGPLQSSNPPFVRAWADPMAAAADHHYMHSVIHPSIGFASGSGFSGFRIPARIRGEEEEEEQQHDGISDKPSSASSGSHH